MSSGFLWWLFESLGQWGQLSPFRKGWEDLATIILLCDPAENGKPTSPDWDQGGRRLGRLGKVLENMGWWEHLLLATMRNWALQKKITWFVCVWIDLRVPGKVGTMCIEENRVWVGRIRKGKREEGAKILWNFSFSLCPRIPGASWRQSCWRWANCWRPPSASRLARRPSRSQLGVLWTVLGGWALFQPGWMY